MMSDAIRWYDQNVSDVSRRYESVAAETVHGWLVDLLPIEARGYRPQRTHAGRGFYGIKVLPRSIRISSCSRNAAVGRKVVPVTSAISRSFSSLNSTPA
jgi:hypothetical protein